MTAPWSKRRLGEVCEFLRGLTYAKGDEVEVSNNIVTRAPNIDLSTNSLDLTELKYIRNSLAVPPEKKDGSQSLVQGGGARCSGTLSPITP